MKLSKEEKKYVLEQLKRFPKSDWRQVARMDNLPCFERKRNSKSFNVRMDAKKTVTIEAYRFDRKVYADKLNKAEGFFWDLVGKTRLEAIDNWLGLV